MAARCRRFVGWAINRRQRTGRRTCGRSGRPAERCIPLACCAHACTAALRTTASWRVRTHSLCSAARAQEAQEIVAAGLVVALAASTACNLAPAWQRWYWVVSLSCCYRHAAAAAAAFSKISPSRPPLAHPPLPEATLIAERLDGEGLGTPARAAPSTCSISSVALPPHHPAPSSHLLTPHLHRPLTIVAYATLQLPSSTWRAATRSSSVQCSVLPPPPSGRGSLRPARTPSQGCRCAGRVHGSSPGSQKAFSCTWSEACRWPSRFAVHK